MEPNLLEEWDVDIMKRVWMGGNYVVVYGRFGRKAGAVASGTRVRQGITLARHSTRMVPEGLTLK